MIEFSYSFTFLRHGESVGNAEERFQGQSDYPLTDKGRQQAHALAERWLKDGVQFDLAVTSPLIRTQETAQIIANALKIPLEVDPVWVERDNGELSGLTREEVEQHFPRPAFITPYDSFGESGEGDWELYLRAGKAVHELIKRPAGKYLIVTHGGLLNKVMYAILGIPVQANSNGPSFRFENAAFATVHYVPSRHQWRMIRFESPASERT
jgi:broad specificity phosphatase PhoE